MRSHFSNEPRICSLKPGTPLKMSGEVCAKCHASGRINPKFKLPADRVATFFNRYHALAAQFGSTVAADCASCHGYPRILPSTDPNSSIIYCPGRDRLRLEIPGFLGGPLLGSSEPLRRWTHRISGLIWLAVGAVHLVCLLTTKEGHRLVPDLLPVRWCLDVSPPLVALFF